MRLLGFCFLLCLLVAIPAAAQQGGGRFVVYPADDIYADSARFYLEFFEKHLTTLLGTPLDTTVSIYLASNEREFLRDSGITPPDWGAGLAFLDDARIVIKSPKYMAVYKSFRELIGHELAHIMLHRAAGGRWLPRWLQEGFSIYASGEWHIGQDITVARAAWTGSLIPLLQLENLSTFRSVKAELAYAQSYLAVARLLRQGDPFLLHDLLDMYRKSGDFYGSWDIVVGYDYVTWITNWLSSISRQYHFFVFLIDEELFWIIIALLFVTLFILKKRQNAKVKRRWDIEERLKPPDNSYKDYYDGYYDEEDKV